MRKVEWISDGGHVCLLEIDDGTSEEVQLTGGAEPFVTQMYDDADLFTPVRSQSGYVRVVGDVDDVAPLVNAAPLDRPVQLTVDGEVAWKGFLSCETFTQAWDRGPIEFELPVESGLEVARSVKRGGGTTDNGQQTTEGGETTDGGQTTDNGQRTTDGGLGYVRIGTFILEMNAKLGGMYERFVFPKLSEPWTTLRYHFCMMNYAEGGETDENGEVSKWGYEMSSYADILEDVCKLFGWSAQERGAELVFQISDADTGYVSYSADELSRLMDGEAVEPSEVGGTVETVEIWGADHDLDYVAGKKSVKAIGNINPYPTAAYTWNIDEKEVKDAYGQERVEDRVSTWYYTKVYDADEEVETISPETNIRYENFLLQSDSYSGCSVVCERVLKVEDRVGAIPTEDSGWVSRVLFRLKGMEYDTVYLKFKPRAAYIASGLTADKFFNLRMKVSRAVGYAGAWESWTGWLKMEMTVGGVAVYDGLIAIRDGELRWSYRGAGVGLSGEGFNVGCPATSGKIEVSFKVPDPMGLDNWGSEDFEHYYSIEEFSIEYINDWTKSLKDEDKKENQAKKELGTGFTENHVSECGLTTYRSGQFGYGIVLGEDASATPPLTLYGGKTAEAALRDRMAAVYSEATERLGVTVHGHGKLLDVCGGYRMQAGGEEYVCVSQDMNWRSDELRGRFLRTTDYGQRTTD